MSKRNGHLNLNGISSDYIIYMSPLVFRAVFSLVILIPVTTFYLDPEDFGLFALIGALILPIQAFSSSASRWVIGGNTFKGMPEKDYEELVFNLLLLELALRSMIVFLYAILAENILMFAFREVNALYLKLFYLAIAASWLGTLWPTISFLMIVQKNALLYAVFSALQIVVNGLICVIGLWWLKWGVETLFYALMVTNFFSLLGELWFVKDQIQLRVSATYIRNITRYFIRSSPGGMIEMANGLAERILITQHVSLAGLGLYNHSQQYLSIMKSATQAFTNVLTPRTLKVYSDGADPKEISALLYFWFAFLSVTGGGIVFFADELLALLTHDKFTKAAPLLIMWVFYSLSVSLGVPYAQYLIAFNRTKSLMLTQVVPSISGLAALWPAINLFGYYGAAATILTVSFVTQFLRRWAATRYGMLATNEWIFYVSIGFLSAVWAIDWLIQPSFMNEIILFFVITISYLWIIGFFSKLRMYGESLSDNLGKGKS